jgi:hypothetical protein
MEVLIVSKTHMSSAFCIGGLVLHTNRYIRLLNHGNYNQPIDSIFKVGDIYDITFIERSNKLPPHIEDVIISTKRYVQSISNISNFLNQLNIIDWNGHINNIFDGNLSWTNSGTGYIPKDGQLPNSSVGFWIADKDLKRVTFDNNKVRYRYANGTIYRNISYVGYQETIETIPAGTILRVSLSRLFPPENSEITAPRGYYLQLSGWYSFEEESRNQNNEIVIDNDDDLPF